MLQETADEFLRAQGTAFFFPAFSVTISKSHLMLIQFQDAVIADGHPEDVRRQVFQGTQSGPHRFTMHHPVLFPNLVWNLWVASFVSQSLMEQRKDEFHFLIHDNGTKFTDKFDAVFRSEDMRVIRTPYQAPNANAFAERWIRTVREECLDHILILNEVHLHNVLREYVEDYYNPARPHQGISQSMPLPRGQPVRSGAVQKRRVLGGIIHDYYRAPVQPSTYIN
jgi:putative transposase